MNKPIYQNNKILFSINAREKPKGQWIIGMVRKLNLTRHWVNSELEGTHLYYVDNMASLAKWKYWKSRNKIK